jgi:hypothetical protein
MEMIFEKIKIAFSMGSYGMTAKCEIIFKDKLDSLLYFNISGIDTNTLKKILDIAEHPTKAILYRKNEDNGNGFQNFVDFLITSIKNLSELQIELNDDIVNTTPNPSTGIFDRYNKYPPYSSGEITYYGPFTTSDNTSNNLVYKPPTINGNVVTKEDLDQFVKYSNEL